MANQDTWVITWTETVQHAVRVNPGIIGQVMTKDQFAAHLHSDLGILHDWSEPGQSGRTVFYHDITVRTDTNPDIPFPPAASLPQTGHSLTHHHDWGQT
jgi:hypothetical protein